MARLRINVLATLRRSQRGTALVELAIVLPLLLVLLLGMLDFGKAYNEWIDETHLANEAARLASVNYCPDVAQSDCGWGTKGCPTAGPISATAGPLGCIAWYTALQADVTELKPSGATCPATPAGAPSLPGRCQDYDAPGQNAAQICVWYPNGFAAGTSCWDHCGTAPATNPNVGDPMQVVVRVQYRWLKYVSSRLNLASTRILGKATVRLEGFLPSNISNPTATGCYPSSAAAGT
jgi:TadE-like protein